MKDDIANVLTLGGMVKVYRVTFDNLDGYFAVHTPEGEGHFVLDEHDMPMLHLNQDARADSDCPKQLRGV